MIVARPVGRSVTPYIFKRKRRRPATGVDQGFSGYLARRGTKMRTRAGGYAEAKEREKLEVEA